jgi:hypothetical protein
MKITLHGVGHEIVVFYSGNSFRSCTKFSLFRIYFIFLQSQDLKIIESTHATFNMGNCEDGHIPTFMWDNKTILPIWDLCEVVSINFHALNK